MYRVALHENVNRMNASSLAIVFAPCVLRTNKLVPAQESLRDIEQQTLCISSIISHQMDKIKSTLADIDTLDTAHHTATHRLSSLRISKVCFLLNKKRRCIDKSIYYFRYRLKAQVKWTKKKNYWLDKYKKLRKKRTI